MWDAAYSTDQSRRGEALYKRDCAPCHGESLEGNAQTDRGQRLERVLPPLSGDVFKGNWNGRLLSDLFDKIRKTMPRDEQGKLTPRDTAKSSRICSSSMNFPPAKRIFRPTPPLTEIQFEGWLFPFWAPAPDRNQLTAFSVAPPDVRCVVITVTGAQTLRKSFDVVPGLPTTLSFQGVSLGDVSVAEQASARTALQCIAGYCEAAYRRGYRQGRYLKRKEGEKG